MNILRCVYLTFLLFLLCTHRNFAQDLPPFTVPINLDSIKKQIGYPLIARELCISGSVALSVSYDESGQVTGWRHHHDPIPVLSDICTQYVPYIRFETTDKKAPGTPGNVDVYVNFFCEGDGNSLFDLYKSGLARQEKKDYSGAKEYYQQVIKDSSFFYVNALIQYAVCEYYVNQFDHAAACFELALSKMKLCNALWHDNTLSPPFLFPIHAETSYLFYREKIAIAQISVSGNRRLDHALNQLIISLFHIIEDKN